MEPINNKTKIILDTCVLNHLFSNNISIGAKILAILAKYKENVWIPYTVYTEFLKINNEDLITKKVKAFKNIGNDFSTLYQEYSQKMQKVFIDIQRQDFEQWKSVEGGIQSIFNNLSDTISTYKKQLDDEAYKNKVSLYLNEVQVFVNELYHNGQVGNPFSASEVIEICREGELRYENLLPPGYSDLKKRGRDRFNDLFIWKEILKYPLRDEMVEGIIFLTDDCKEGNWWNPQKKSGNPETIHKFLLNEFQEIHCSYEEEKFIDLKFMTLVSFSEFCNSIFDIETCLKIEEEKQVEKLLKIFETSICNEMHTFVACMDFTKISEEFYINNDGEIFENDLKLCSYCFEIKDKYIEYELSVELPFELIIAYEDNDGDRIILGEAELLLSAIVSIRQEFIKNNKLNTYTILTPKKINEANFTVSSISYEVISCKDPYDYYK